MILIAVPFPNIQNKIVQPVQVKKWREAIAISEIIILHQYQVYTVIGRSITVNSTHTMIHNNINAGVSTSTPACKMIPTSIHQQNCNL